MTKVEATQVAKPARDPALETLERTSRQFEALLFREMVKAMVSSSTEGGFFGKETGSDTWEEMFESGLSDFLSEHGSLGLATHIYEQYSPRITTSPHEHPPLEPTVEPKQTR